MKRTLLLAILFSLLSFGCHSISNFPFPSDVPFPSDAELIKNFQDNESDFQRLNQMAKEDSDFVRIANDFNWTKESTAYPRPKSQKDLSEERWNEYRGLFLKLKLKNGIINSPPKMIWFSSASQGLVTGGSSKGYMYLIEEPSPLVDSLDEPNFDKPELEGKDFKILYKKLKDNWYLYYEVNG